MMKVRRVDGGLQVHSVIDYTRDHLQDGVCNSRPAGAADREIKIAIRPENKRRCHRRERTFPRRDRVALTLNGAIKIRGAWFGGEVVHLVVEQESGPFRDNAGTEPAV